MKRLILPFLLTLCFYLESVFVELTPLGTFKADILLVPHFLLVLFIVMGIFYLRNHTLIYAAVFGLLFDVYYTEIIGVYLFLFPIIVYIASKMVKVVHANILTIFFITLICLGTVEFAIFGLNTIVLQRSMDIHDFLNQRLWPTLITNEIFFLIIFFPFKKLLSQRKKVELHE